MAGKLLKGMTGAVGQAEAAQHDFALALRQKFQQTLDPGFQDVLAGFLLRGEDVGVFDGLDVDGACVGIIDGLDVIGFKDGDSVGVLLVGAIDVGDAGAVVDSMNESSMLGTFQTSDSSNDVSIIPPPDDTASETSVSS